MSDDDKPDLELGIYRVTHTLIVGEARLIAESDFVYQNDEPLLVLEWIRRAKGDLWPGLTLPLDPKLLKAVPNSPGYYLYSGQLVDPRTVQ